jgi:hypothetical protein
MIHGPSGPKPGAFFAVQKREPDATSLLRVAAREIVQERDTGQVIERIRATGIVRRLADHKNELGLVVEMRDARRPHHIGIVAR